MKLKRENIQLTKKQTHACDVLRTFKRTYVFTDRLKPDMAMVHCSRADCPLGTWFHLDCMNIATIPDVTEDCVTRIQSQVCQFVCSNTLQNIGHAMSCQPDD